MATNMKLAFRNLPFRHNSACVKKAVKIQKGYHSQISMYLINIF